ATAPQPGRPLTSCAALCESRTASLARGANAPPAQKLDRYPSSDHGLRMTRARYLLASASSTNCSLAGSYFTSRLSHMQMLQACTVLIERCMTVGLATVCFRDLTQSKKSRT